MDTCSSAVLEAGELDWMRKSNNQLHNFWFAGLTHPSMNTTPRRRRRRVAAMGLGLITVSAEIRDKRSRLPHCNIPQSPRCY